MNVLIIAINQEKLPIAVAPIGAACMVRTLERHGHEAYFVDLCFVGNLKRKLTSILKKIDPDIVGLSIRNLDNCSSTNQKTFFQTARRVIQTVRGCSRATVIMGGGGVSVLPRELAEYLDVSYTFIGEGEESLPAFLTALSSKKDFSSVPGLLYRQKGCWHLNPPDFGGDLDRFPLYAYEKINHKKYFENGGFIGYQTKRGCPFKCIYCNYPTLEGVRQRKRSPRLCADDMEQLVRGDRFP